MRTEKRFLGKSKPNGVVKFGYFGRRILIRTFFVLSDVAVLSRHNLRTILRFEAFVCDLKIITRGTRQFFLNQFFSGQELRRLMWVTCQIFG